MGSPNGLWTAVSGGMAQSQNVDIIANNLANVNTTAFKKDTPTFKEYLTAVERPPSPIIDIPRTAFRDSDFYHHDGREHAMVNLDKVHTDHSQGNLRPTNAPFDLAIDGPGFFAVRGPSGLMYTRSGDFKITGDGQFVTTDGYPVLVLPEDAAAQPADGRSPANVNPFNNTQTPLKPVSFKEALANGERIRISNNGQIFAGEQAIGTLAVAEFVDPRALQKVTANLYANPDAANVPRVARASSVQQGFLEASNVNAVSELLDLLKANRMFESSMKAIKAYSDMAGKEANEVGKL